MINILQMGLGPLGVKTFNYIAEKQTMCTLAAVDINPSLAGQDLGTICGTDPAGVIIKSHLSEVENIEEIDVVVLTTSSSINAIGPQVNEILDYNLPIVSTCEELSYPWLNAEGLAQALDEKAKDRNVAIVSTGVNPGFLMDTLPSLLTSVCKKVNHVHVNRIQDAQTRRIPFQKKIGAGLDLKEFDVRKANGSLRHVGLTESMQFISTAVGWTIDHTEDVITPIIAESDIQTDAMFIPKGNAMGVRQVGVASYKGEEKIKLIFEAAVGTGTSYDEVKITGQPDIHSRIEGGVHGDIATCSIVLNAIPSILKSTPGLKTMRDIPLVSFTQ